MLIRKNRFLSSASLAVMACSLSVISTPALAGFEWTPPEKAAPTPIPAPRPAPVHQMPMDSSALPEVGDFEVPAEEQSAPEPQMQQDPESGKLHVIDMKRAEPEPMPEPTPEVEAAPEPFPLTEAPPMQEEPAPAPVPGEVNINPYPLESGNATPPVEETAAPAQGEEIAWQNTGFEVLEGFGSDMPLALALQQVVPAKYAYSFGRGVNPGHLVSWEGGKPWNQVLGDMIRPLGLVPQIEGNIVKIVALNAPPAPVLQPEPQPEAAAEPLPPLENEPEKQAAAPVAEEIMPEPVLEKTAKEEVVKKAEPVKEAAETKTKKVSTSRHVILDPGESKPLEPANKAAKKQPEKEEAVKMAKAEPEANPPSEEALESADINPASADAGEQQMGQPRIWEAKRGSSLKETLDAWTKQAHVTLTWNAQDDVKLGSNILISGTFENAVKVLFAQAVKSGPSHTLKSGPSAELIVGDEIASEQSSAG